MHHLHNWLEVLLANIATLYPPPISPALPLLQQAGPEVHPKSKSREPKWKYTQAVASCWELLALQNPMTEAGGHARPSAGRRASKAEKVEGLSLFWDTKRGPFPSRSQQCSYRARWFRSFDHHKNHCTMKTVLSTALTWNFSSGFLFFVTTESRLALICRMKPSNGRSWKQSREMVIRYNRKWHHQSLWIGTWSDQSGFKKEGFGSSIQDQLDDPRIMEASSEVHAIRGESYL